MLLKLIALIAAAIPLILFVRSVFVRRSTRASEALTEFKKRVNLAISIFLVMIGCVVVFALGKLAWAWWTSI
jgi:phosphate/sulfate permease